jgi:two-component system nitrogen regulation response regulator NtrX
MALLQEYEWPGNVRELQNIIERLIIVVEGEEIDSSDVATATSNSKNVATGGRPLREMVSEYEKGLVLEALHRNDWNISQAAKELKIDRANLHRKLRQWDL